MLNIVIYNIIPIRVKDFLHLFHYFFEGRPLSYIENLKIMKIILDLHSVPVVYSCIRNERKRLN